jgi:predicted RNA-binding Zn-ribbon protein involved in translation (DUF1610 family)
VLRRLESHVCPGCGNQLRRTHRLLHQKIISVIIPLARYRCPSCGHIVLALSSHPRRDNPLLSRPTNTLFYLIILLALLILFFIVC